MEDLIKKQAFNEQGNNNVFHNQLYQFILAALLLVRLKSAQDKIDGRNLVIEISRKTLLYSCQQIFINIYFDTDLTK